MDMDRGTLARIDRKLLAGLGGDETFRMVRVPVTAAMWSTRKRYCNAAGISMGRAIAGLIAHDVSSVLGGVGGVGGVGGEGSAVFSARVQEELAKRREEVARREQELEAAEDRLRAWDRQLRRRRGNLEARERQAELAARPSSRPEGLVNWGGGAWIDRCRLKGGVERHISRRSKLVASAQGPVEISNPHAVRRRRSLGPRPVRSSSPIDAPPPETRPERLPRAARRPDTLARRHRPGKREDALSR
jgi:hypothetical protein